MEKALVVEVQRPPSNEQPLSAVFTTAGMGSDDGPDKREDDRNTDQHESANRVDLRADAKADG